MNEQALKDRVHTISKEKGIHFNECWKKLILERFLLRLSRSKYPNKFIFKGGLLLAYLMEIGRETTDLDFLLTNMNTGKEIIEKAIYEIISMALNDGFSFSYEGIEQLEQPHMDYPGYRILLQAKFGRMKDKVQIDVGTGDIVTPSTRNFELFGYRGKPLFESEISLQVYPPETIFAEKLETVLSKGSINSRMKDYHDLLLLTRSKLVQSDALKKAIKDTFENRGTQFELISFSEDSIKLVQKLWAAHRNNLGERAQTLELSNDIQEIIQEINSYLLRIH